MSTRPKFRHRLEYGFVKTIGAVLNAMPYRCALVFAFVLSRIAYALSWGRRREAMRRVRLVFGETVTPRDVQRICWISFRNTFFNAVEMLRVSTFDLADMQEMIPEIEQTIEKLRAVLAKTEGRGLILALPHMGNWDLAGSGCYLSGLPIFSVAGKQRNTRMNDLINKQRSGHGMDIIERGSGTLRQIMTRIKSGQIFAILPDTRSFTPDIMVPFLGGAANLARGMASFAYSAKVPVVPIMIRRKGWSHFTLEVHDEIWPDLAVEKDVEIKRITEEVISKIDTAIHATPEQWFWYNKRWVLDPVTENATREKTAESSDSAK